MKALLAATLLATCVTAQAELHERTMKVMCGTAEDFNVTVQKYEETAVVYAASAADSSQITYGLYANFKSGTTSWVAHVGQTDEYCMIGIGDQIYTPNSSPLKDTPIGTRTIYK